MNILPANDDTLAQAVHLLGLGETIAHATETCYGFACDITDAKAVEKLFAIKQRPADQPVSALFASVEHAKEFVQWPQLADDFAKQYLPGPLTIVLPLRKELFPTAQGGDCIGIRISSHPIATQLVKLYGKPITTTSANVHGKPNPYAIHEIEHQFDQEALQPSLIIDSGALQEVPASSVVKIEGNEVIVLRQGMLKF